MPSALADATHVRRRVEMAAIHQAAAQPRTVNNGALRTAVASARGAFDLLPLSSELGQPGLEVRRERPELAGLNVEYQDRRLVRPVVEHERFLAAVGADHNEL